MFQVVFAVPHSGFSFSTQIWHFCTKLTSRVLKSKEKVASSGIWTHNSNHYWIRILTTLPTQQPRHLLNRKSLNWSWIISRINRAWLYKGLKIWDCQVWKSETAMDWQIGWVGKAVRILIQWWLLLWVQIPQEPASFYFLKALMSILYRNVRFVLKTKNPIRFIIIVAKRTVCRCCSFHQSKHNLPCDWLICFTGSYWRLHSVLIDRHLGFDNGAEVTCDNYSEPFYIMADFTQ